MVILSICWILSSLASPAIQIHYGDDFNVTHVLVEGRYFAVVDCSHKNGSEDRAPEPPVLDYAATPLLQAFFEDRAPHRRAACLSVRPRCSCEDEPASPLGYRCDCPYKTSFFYKYYDDLAQRFEGRCEAFLSLCDKCHSRNTLACLIVNTTAVRCQCFKGYEPSSNCFEKYNACDKAPEGSSLSGNEACKIKEKNKCLASIGFQKYICQCFYPNKEDYNIGFPNCMGKKVKKCDSVLCINGGICDSSTLGQCKCQKGFSGKYCEVVQYRYIGTWTPWSSCYPECGNYGLRSSDSVCDGPIKKFCSGIIRKWERCSAISCGLRFLSSVQNKSIQGLRNHLTHMLTLTKEEGITLFYILWIGGFSTGLLYIVITEIIG